jgi:hypothetical protein
MPGRALVPVEGAWRTTNTAAGRSAGSEAAMLTSASTPPAEAPTTTMSWSAWWASIEVVEEGWR